MSLLTPGQYPTRAIDLEHAELKTLVESFTDVCRKTNRNQREVQTFADKLAKAVAEHFALEERGGYFADAVRRAPHLQPTATELQAQHEPLLESLEALRALARLGVKSEAGWVRMQAELDQFADELLKHEAGERALLQRAYAQDIGAGD
jgi:hypothetical protein